jgi:hypothetical protein
MGIPTITVLVLFMGGVQLAAVGVLGEYVGRIYDEVRRRPLYAIDKAWNVRVRDSHGPMSGLREFVQLGNAVGDGREQPEQVTSAVAAREDPHG